MKKSLYTLVAASAVVALLAACAKEVESVPTDDNNGPVYITASINQETKSTLNETSGVFAFSNGDAIKVCNDSGTHSGTTESTTNSGTFAMEAGFNGSTDGIAGFPASLVKEMDKNSVTFTIPTNYDYSAVGSGDPVAAAGGNDAASAAKVPCPMMGSYDSDSKKVTLMQCGAIIRFRVTEIAAGSLSFSFPDYVTGDVKIETVPNPGDEDGITARDFIVKSPYIFPGNTVTINSVPDVGENEYIYISLPVPTKADLSEILITNTPSVGTLPSRMVAISGPDSGPVRAHGLKRSALLQEVALPRVKVSESKEVILAPGNLMAKIGEFHHVSGSGTLGISYATASEWKFGGYLEGIGGAADKGNYLFSQHNSACEGKWVDLFMWQGEDATYKYQGLISIPDTQNTEWVGNETGTVGSVVSIYDGCWTNDPFKEGHIDISNGGGYTWYPLTYADWCYILGKNVSETRPGATDPSGARFARVKVNGTNALMIIPDGITWNTTNFGAIPDDVNGGATGFDWDTNVTTYTATNFVNMVNAGIVFLPASGVRQVNGVNSYGKEGHYWCSTSDLNSKYARYVEFKKSNLNIGGWSRWWARAVRLARDVE